MLFIFINQRFCDTQDGIFLSDNGGSSFTKVYDLTGGSATHQEIVLDIDALASANGLSLSSTFVVKLQQYDNYPFTSDGMGLDDVSVATGGTGGDTQPPSVPSGLAAASISETSFTLS